MYTGNGVTKKFPIPAGYDGQVVILTMPSGKGIKMTEGDGYKIEGDSIIFFAAVPAGITISFDESQAGELVNTNSGGYVVIYSDGSMKEITEDPALLLEQTQKILSEAKKKADEISQTSNEAISYITGLLSTVNADLEGRLTGYAQRAEEIIAEAAAEVKIQIRNDYAPTLESLTEKSNEIRESLQVMELLKDEIRESAITAAKDTKLEIISQCQNVITACENLGQLKNEIQNLSESTRSEIIQERNKFLDSIELKAQQELEALKSLRLKMENDYQMLNTKINNRWDLLRGEIDGR